MLETPHESYSFGEFTLDVSGHLFLRGQDEIKLTGKPFKALVHLVKKPNTLVTKNELIDAVYGGDINLTPDAPKKWIDQIRAALGEHDQMIEIVRGEGWRFKADVKAKARPMVRGADESLLRGGAGTFKEWRRGPGKGITLALGAGVIGTTALSIGIALWRKDNVAGKMAASVGQCVVILFAFVHSWFWEGAKGLRPKEQCDELDVKAAGFADGEDFATDTTYLTSTLQEYRKYWRLLLLSWVPLYVSFAIARFLSANAEGLEILFNILNTAMIVLCFNVLNRHLDEGSNKQGLTGSASIVLIFAVILAVLIGIELSITILNIDATQLLNFGTILTGIAAGIAMALYVGRLQSKFLRPGPALLILLYSYTAIQPLVLYIGRHPGWGMLLLDFALLLKCVLYLYMTWLFQSGLLLFYFAMAERTHPEVERKWAAFQKLLG